MPHQDAAAPSSAPEPLSAEDLASSRAELKETREALRQADLRFRTVMDSISDGLAVLDKEWRYTYVNEQAAQLIGVSREQLLGNNVWELFPAARGTKFEEGYFRAMTTGERVDLEDYYPDPINKWLECFCYPSPEGLTVYFHDVTARKQAEEALRRNELLFATLIEQAPLGMYVVNADFRVQQVNSRALPAFGGLTPLVGRDFAEIMLYLWGPEVGGECTRIFRHTMATGEPYISPPFQNQRYDVEFEQAVEWETQRVTLPDGRYGVACYFTDVTERRRHEAALLKAREEAEMANASKDRFLAVLSHELRTPLNPVLLSVSALENDPALPGGLREELAMIRRNVELETKLIDDLLDLSRIANGKLVLNLEPVDLTAAVREVCEICRPQTLEKQIQVEVATDGAAAHIEADPARLHQVLWNVIRNAVRFSPPQSHIHITITRCPATCEVRVHDHGIGIPAEVMPRIFQAFEQGDPRITQQFGGLGLGLAISRRLVELHGGSIRAESAGENHGATFIIEFPALPPRETAAASAPAPPPAAEHNGKNLRILLVEDHADTLRTLSRLLQRRGYQVTSAHSVASAGEAISQAEFDLVISDLGLPDGTGLDVMQRMHARHPIPGIALSGYGMEDDIRRSQAAGFSEHIVKPVNLGLLLEAIQRAATRV